MDVDLHALAAVSEALTRGENAAAEDAFTAARDALSEADAGLEDARARWRAADGTARTTIAAVAGPLRARRDALAARLPPVRALSEGTPTADPDDERDPEASAPDAVVPAAPAPPVGVPAAASVAPAGDRPPPAAG